MNRIALLALAAAAVLAGCPTPKAKSCSVNSDCPADSVCVQQICQKGVPSGGASSAVTGSGHLSGGTLTMDAVVGQPVVVGGSAGTTTLKPAENTR